MVFQSYALYPHMSVYDNMAFGLSLRKTPKADIARRVQEAARILGIEDLLKRKPRQLSGGQRQRVALGRAIVREPAAFPLDEPLSNLDAKLRVQTRTELNKLHQRLGTTFIYVTHDQVEAMTMAGRIAVLSKGVLQQVGTPQALYDKPGNIFVAGFIGSPSMNFIEAAVARDGDTLSLHAEDLDVTVPDEQKGDLEKYAGKKVIFGIRPEDIHAPEYLAPGIVASPVRARVDVTEMIGNEVFLRVVTGKWEYLARVDSRMQARPGQDVDLVLNMSKMHAFDPATEARIT
jgi:multiple sugar transport system ATP-binding protein